MRNISLFAGVAVLFLIAVGTWIGVGTWTSAGALADSTAASLVSCSLAAGARPTSRRARRLTSGRSPQKDTGRKLRASFARNAGQ